MSFSSMPQPASISASDPFGRGFLATLTQSNTNNSNLTPADAGFVGFTGVRANANSFQVVDSRGNTAFISGQQAANYGLVNSAGMDFSGVTRFLPQNISFVTPSTPTASGTPTPSPGTVPSNTSNPSTGRSLGATASDALTQVKSALGTTGFFIAAGLLIYLVIKR